MNPILREYQHEAVDFLVRGSPGGVGRAGCADDMGLGKTPEAISAAKKLGARRTLVITRKVALHVWQNELATWWPEIGTPTVITSAVDQHTLLPTEGVVVCTFGMSASLLQRQVVWDLIIGDEAHLWRNRNNNWEAVCKAQSKHLFLLTGSPIVNHFTDMWPLLHLLDPKKFRSRWKWIDQWFEVEKGLHGGRDIGPCKDSGALRAELKRYWIRRNKERPDIAAQIPPKVRRAVPIEMTPAQRKLYDQMAKDMLINDGRAFVVASNQMTQMLRLRQLLVTPQLLGHSDIGAAIPAVKELADAEREAGNHVLIFTPFAAALPFIREVFEGGKNPPPVLEIRGGLSQGKIKNTLDLYWHSKRPAVLMSTISAATSWNAQVASAAFFLGTEYTAKVNEQAEDRGHRLGGGGLRVNYMLHRNTVEDHIMDILDGKVTFHNLAFDPHKLLKR